MVLLTEAFKELSISVLNEKNKHRIEKALLDVWCIYVTQIDGHYNNF